MRACFGLKAHCGWSALVLLGRLEGDFAVLDRRRIELVEPDAASWARQPYQKASGSMEKYAVLIREKLAGRKESP